jgi:selenocysteine lyase/cysteine desulfurase
VVPIPLRSDYTIDIDTLAQVLTPRTRVVCISAASNVTGEIVDLAQVRRILDTVYTPDTMPWLVVDASQYIPHHDIDIVTLGIDALVCTGHKMMSDT